MLMASNFASRETTEPAGLGQNILIPSVNEVRKHGYPYNELGETYGPDIKEFDYEPDLLLVRHGELHGYIRQSELNDSIQSPEDVKKQRQQKGKEVKIYLHDGVTCIGIFKVEAGLLEGEMK